MQPQSETPVCTKGDLVEKGLLFKGDSANPSFEHIHIKQGKCVYQQINAEMSLAMVGILYTCVNIMFDTPFPWGNGVSNESIRI